MGTDLSSEEVEERLQRYGFSVARNADAGFNILVPTHRIWDVHTVFDDIYEEIAKSVGYNAIPTTLPKIDKGALPSRLEKHRDLVENLLIGAGFLEVITDGFYGRTDFDKLGLPVDHVLQNHVETQNSLDKVLVTQKPAVYCRRSTVCARTCTATTPTSKCMNGLELSTSIHRQAMVSVMNS